MKPRSSSGERDFFDTTPDGGTRNICDFSFENRLVAGGVRIVAGIDEAGRGPLAGPVIAAAAVFEEHIDGPARLNDSKKLSAGTRERLFELLSTMPGFHYGIGRADAHEIDSLNILRATHLAMRRALEALPVRPGHALIDGLPVHPFPVPHTAVVSGDGRSLSIAAASVLAKVTRDRIMNTMDREFPEYGFARHKGYGTKQHLEALGRLGPCPQHRLSFAPVAGAAAARR